MIISIYANGLDYYSFIHCSPHLVAYKASNLRHHLTGLVFWLACSVVDKEVRGSSLT